MRLRTLPVSVAGVIMAIGYNISTGTLKCLPVLLCLAFAVLCQIASNFANEYYDYKAGRDRVGREGPRRGVTEGDIAPRAMKFAIFAVLAAAALIGLSLTCWGGLWLIAAGILIGVGALAYSTGPWPLSTHCLGEVAVIIFFGIIPVNLTYYRPGTAVVAGSSCRFARIRPNGCQCPHCKQTIATSTTIKPWANTHSLQFSDARQCLPFIYSIPLPHRFLH